VPEVDPDDVRRLADEVLADPAFDRPAPGLLVSARDWALDRLGDAVGELLDAAGGGPLGWIVVAAFSVAAVGLAVRFGVGLQRDPTAVVVPAGPRRAATDWEADAARLEAAGEWRGALRCRYRALVAALAARGLVDEVPGRTAGEYRAAVASAVPEVAAPFAGATALFEDAWYGHRGVGPVDARRLADLSARVLAGAGGPR
jgi:hypothetical protein